MKNKILNFAMQSVLIILCIFLGMLIQKILYPQIPISKINTALFAKTSKLDALVNMLNISYVDTVDVAKMEEDAIGELLKDLDPHTVYIPAKDLQRTNEDIVGQFGGVGIQFYKYQDTVTVIKIVPGGPSENAGILDGDRIVKVGDSIITGKNVNNDKIMSMMRGDLGTDVDFTIIRKGEKEPIIKHVTRGNIPLKSVEVAYMLSDTIGLIKVSSFSMTTYNEFVIALEQLKAQGMTHLVVDLRENGGGVLPIAIRMINEFLPSDRLIVYTQGKAVPRMDYKSNGEGRYQDMGITVLINELSASASEIFAGAIQDNDRGQIIGRRSFGKGLVQEQRILPDGSGLRLTVARYYIPSGRSIQKPYDKGKEAYSTEILNRFIHGEFSEKDSIHFNKELKFTTLGGRTVYGGGGVMPDIFVPADTIGYSEYFGKVARRSQILYDFTIDFMDKHRHETLEIKNYKQVLEYLDKFKLVDNLALYAKKKGVAPNYKQIAVSRDLIDNYIKSFIGRHIMDDGGFYPILYLKDTTVDMALKQITKK